MAAQGVRVTVVDLSGVAAGNATAAARKQGLTVDFRCGNVLDLAITEGPLVDFIYDSGTGRCAPRRISTPMLWRAGGKLPLENAPDFRPADLDAG